MAQPSESKHGLSTYMYVYIYVYVKPILKYSAHSNRSERILIDQHGSTGMPSRVVVWNLQGLYTFLQFLEFRPEVTVMEPRMKN